MSIIALGCYTTGSGGASENPGRGITLLRFDRASLDLVDGPLIECESPSFVLWHPSGETLYACHEGSEGQVSAYRISGAEVEDLNISTLGSLPTGGADPCHLALVNANGPDAASPTHLLVSNYSGGSLAVFEILRDGALGERTALAQHQGSSVVSERQSGAHVHQAVAEWDEAHGALVRVVDLGLDVVRTYALDAQGCLTERSETTLPPGAGPRQVLLGAPGLDEVASSNADLETVDLDDAEGPQSDLESDFELRRGGDDADESNVHVPLVQPEDLAPAQPLVSTETTEVVLAELDSHLYLTTGGAPRNGVRTTRFEGENFPAQLLALGQSVVVSNRGANTVAFLRIQGDSVSLCAEVPVGAWPRHVEAIQGDKESYLLVSNQWGDSISVLRVEHGSGASETVSLVAEYEAESPSCIAVRPRP